MGNDKWLDKQLRCSACGYIAEDIVQMHVVTVDNYTQMICANCYVLTIKAQLHGIMSTVLTLDINTMAEVTNIFTEIIESCPRQK